MPQKRNELGQYIRNNDYKVFICLPGPLTIIKYLLIVLIVSPWLFILTYKLSLMDLIQKTMENIFLVKNEDGKKYNGFF